MDGSQRLLPRVAAHIFSNRSRTRLLAVLGLAALLTAVIIFAASTGAFRDVQPVLGRADYRDFGGISAAFTHDAGGGRMTTAAMPGLQAARVYPAKENKQ